MHEIKHSAKLNEYTFAYGSMASITEIFTSLKIKQHSGQFVNSFKDFKKTYEEIPTDQLMNDLKSKTPRDRVFEINSSPVYKCLGNIDLSYVLMKATIETNMLQVNDTIYSEKSDGYLETINSIRKIVVSDNEQRLVIETQMTNCGSILETLETKIRNIKLINLHTTELNCEGGEKSDLSLYVTENKGSISKLFKTESLIENVIVGRESKKFAFRISSVKRLGSYLLFECISLKNSSNVGRGWYSFQFNAYKDFTYQASKNIDFKIDGLQSLGSASASLFFNPYIKFEVDIQSNWIGIPYLQTIGLTLGAKMNINFKLNIDLTTLNYQFKEIELLSTTFNFYVLVAGIPVPGTARLFLTGQTGISMVFQKPVTYNFEYNQDFTLKLPFVYRDNRDKETPSSDSFKIGTPTVTNQLDISGLKSSPTLSLTETFNLNLNPKFPDISENDLKKVLPSWLRSFARKVLDFIQLSITATQPVIEKISLTTCTADCMRQSKSIQLKSETSLDNLKFEVSCFNLKSNFEIKTATTLLSKLICLPFIVNLW